MTTDQPGWQAVGRQAGWLVLAALLPALLAAALHPRRPSFAAEAPVFAVTAATVRSWPKILWVDARPAPEFTAGHVPGAVPLNEDRWEALLPGFLDAWTPGCRVVVYCDTRRCDTARAVAARLRRELRIENLFVLEGGWNAWRRAQN